VGNRRHLLNTEERRAKARAYYVANLDRIKAQRKAYREANREKIRKQQKAYSLAHQDEIKERQKSYQKTHREELRAQKKVYREAHRDEIRASCKAWRAANLDEQRAKERAYQKIWRAANPEIAAAGERDRHYKSHYGISTDEYNEILLSQNGRCLICGAEPDGRALDVDHDHETGKVRGLLCHRCNLGVGIFEDDPDLLTAVAEYLKTKEAQNYQALFSD
jgi:hypothetical protein